MDFSPRLVLDSSSDPRVNDRACGLEWLSAPLLLFTKSERVLFLLNFIPFLLLPGMILALWRHLGVRSRVAYYWMWLLPTSYVFLLQGGSAGNDLFPVVYLLAAMVFAIQARANNQITDLWYSIIAAALAIGAKPTCLPLMLPWGLLVFGALPLLKRENSDHGFGLYNLTACIIPAERVAKHPLLR